MQIASGIVEPSFNDEAFLRAWRKESDPASFREAIEIYGPLVYSAARRQTNSPDQAAEVTRAVFLALANRARKLPKKTILADWLFQTTALAARKISKQSRFRRLLRWLRPQRKRTWTLDEGVLRLRKKQRRAVLLSAFLNRNEGFSKKSLDRGLRKLQRRRVSIEPLVPLPDGLAEEILAAIPPNPRRKPADKLTRSVVKTMRWRIRRRRFYFAFVAWHLFLTIAIGTFLYFDSKIGFSRTFSLWVSTEVRIYALSTAASRARPWPNTNTTPQLSAATIRNAADLYKTTNIWQAHFHFTPEQWKAFQPRGIEPLPNLFLPDGMILVRNPAAPRSGFAGVLGYAYDWTHADFDFGGLNFRDAAVRLKGNAAAIAGVKPTFKVDLNKYDKRQSLAGLDELTFNNILWDQSSLAETLGYEFFRDAGVPAPRTAFAWISATVDEKWNHKPLGLYVMLEPIDSHFALDHFGSRHAPIFKPVTYELFKYLGPDWSAYADIYDLKTRASAKQKERVIDLCRLVTSGSEAEFAAKLPEFLDLDEFARYIAAETFIASYDGIFTTGQNFYMYLDPRSNKFGIIPWDLDSAWGNFWIGKRPQLARASIWHPWVVKNHFLERVMALEEFRIIYRARMEEVSALLDKQRLKRKIDELAPILREPLAAESPSRLNLFEQYASLKPIQKRNKILEAFDRPVNPILDFVEIRARSIRQQLDGKTHGFIIKPPAEQD